MNQPYKAKEVKKERMKCIESFESEKRFCIEGNTYIAEHSESNVAFIFENGAMNFTPELWEKVKTAWESVLTNEESAE